MRFNIPVTNQRQQTPEPEPDGTGEMRDKYGGEPERVLAAQVRAIRDNLGMTQAEVAKEMSARGHPMRQSTIAKIEAAQRPVRVNEAVTLAAILRVSLADLLADRDRRDAIAAARYEEREVLGQLLQASYRLEEHRAAHAAAGHAVAEAAKRVETIEALYAQAQYLVATLAEAGNERSESDQSRGR